jgi:hypothetical protein
VVPARERGLGPVLPQYPVLLVRQALSPSVVVELQTIGLISGICFGHAFFLARDSFGHGTLPRQVHLTG